MKMLKNDLKDILRFSVFFLFLAILIVGTSCLFPPKNYWEEFRKGENPTAHAVLNEPEDSIDVLFLGDSLVYSAISPMELWKNYGFTSFDCAGTSQQMFACESLLRSTLEKQNPKVIVFDPYSLYRGEKQISKLRARINALFPIFIYHDRWKNIDKAYLSGFFNVNGTDSFKGFALKWNAEKGKPYDHMRKTDKRENVPVFNEEYFKSIVNICNEAGIELVLISVPSQKCWNYEKHNGIQTLADQYGIEYVDLNLMNDRISINWETDTRDAGDHLNYYGAKKVSEFIGEYLKDRYSLPDHRDDDNYSQWNEALEDYMFFVDTKKK